MFIAFFALTERRIAYGYRDICCCPAFARESSVSQPLTSSPSVLVVATDAYLGQPPSPTMPERSSSATALTRPGDDDAPGQASTPVEENWIKYVFRVYCES